MDAAVAAEHSDFPPLSPIVQMPMLWLRSPPPGDGWRRAIVSVLALRCRGVRGTVDDGGDLEEPVGPAGNLKMIIRARRSAAGADRKLTANITTVVSG